MKILYILHKIDDAVMNEGNGGRRRIVRGHPAMPIDYIDNKLILIVCMIFLLDID